MKLESCKPQLGVLVAGGLHLYLGTSECDWVAIGGAPVSEVSLSWLVGDSPAETIGTFGFFMEIIADL